MEKVLKLFTYVDGGINDTPFPDTDNQIEIGAFRYDAKRMGGAPTITASVNYPTCLDDVWTDNVYAEFNGEKYYLKQTPTSSYDNEDVMYKHDLELISERASLDNVYFFDVVTGNPQESDKPVSNSTKVVFFGDILEFAERLQASLDYSGLDYTVEVDEGISSEEKLMSFENQFFSNVLQEIYKTYEIPYYFDGKTIHIGWAKDDVVIPTFGYGVDNALLSITKNNANYKVVNRATGTGSSDNIPFYYPNKSPKGVITAEVSSASGIEVGVRDYEKFSDNVGIDEILEFSSAEYSDVYFSGRSYGYAEPDTYYTMSYGGFWASQPLHTDSIDVYFDADTVGEIPFSVNFIQESFKIEGTEQSISPTIEKKVNIVLSYEKEQTTAYGGWQKVFTHSADGDSANTILPIEKTGHYRVTVDFCHRHVGEYVKEDVSYLTKVSYALSDLQGWTLRGRSVELKDIGLYCNGTPSVGDTIKQTLVEYINTAQTLMPYKYRETKGADRFYNATNGTYEGVTFNNPYSEGKRREHIISVEDIKPTIEETVNSMGLRMDMFSAFDYDDDDNDETVENEDGSDRDYVHSYFFGKLRKLDFNLFDHAIEQQPMTISFTSGDCGACRFEIGVTEDFPQKNPVQVDANGNLVKKNGRVVCGQFEEITEDQIQDRQQDTINNEVWIALKKEDKTYGILMPKAPVGGAAAHRPKACTEGQNDGDTFVILGINLPESYIINAEKKLEAEIIKYLKDNNDEKFTFSISFSRIYFEENPDVLAFLSENSKIAITYDNKNYNLYVSSFSYQMAEGDALPQITVELDDTLQVAQNALQNAISEVKSELGRAMNNVDVVGMGTPYFIRKDADDEARGTIDFKKGIKFGEGGKVEVLDNNSAKLTIEYLEVTKKATFTSLEIQEKTHVGGQILVTLASINCGEVEEFEDYYRCYFQTKGIDGDEIFNQFTVGDQAICQTYNAWGSRYYWRLVTGVGEDYIDLSKVEGEYDEESGIPSAGDKIIQLGNQVDGARQNAIVISAHSEDAPCIIQYKNINTFSISDENIVTKLSPYGNLITGVLRIEKGTTGVENLEGLPEFIHENVGEVETGESGSNLLRNSGFTGDYLSEELADEDVLVAESQMFSSPLDYWTANEVTVEANEESESGFGVVFASQGSLAQTLHYNLIANEGYVLSFRAKSATGAAIVYTIGDQTGEVVLTNESARYVVKVVVTSSSKAFSLTCDDCSLWEVQLERGTMASSWGRSFLDNSSDRVYWQAQKYISGAIEDASTTFAGGLGLTNMMMFGNYDKETKSMVEVTAGVSGNYEDDHDVAFWAGGDYNSAVKAVADYLINHDKGTWQPTDAELATMAKFVLTHGGTAILNDIILRGYVYATGGNFQGKIDIDAKNVNGRVVIDDNGLVYYGTDGDNGEYQRVALGSTCQAASGVFLAPNADALYCVRAALLAVGDENTSAIVANGDVFIDGNLNVANGEVNATKLYVGEIVPSYGVDDSLFLNIPNGMVKGLRTITKVVESSSVELNESDFSVLINATSGSVTITFPSSPMDGQEYMIETKGADLTINSSAHIYNHYNGEWLTGSITNRGVIRFKYYDSAHQWTMTWVDRY